MPKYTKTVLACPFGIRTSASPVVTGAADAPTALNDTSDSTYVKTNSATLPLDSQCQQASFVSGERIVSVVPWVRSKQPGSKSVRAVVGFFQHDYPASEYFFSEGVALSLPTVVGTITDYELAAQNGQLLIPGLGIEWGLNTVPTAWPTLSFYDPHTADANRALWYKAGLYVYTLKNATVANPTAPTGTITTTQYPTCTATVSAVVDSWQKPSGLPDFLTGITIEWSVYSGSLTSPSGTALLTWTQKITISNYIDGTTASTLAASTTPPAALPNGALTLFARVSRDHPSGSPSWSAYGYKQFTMSVPNPTTPTLTLSADSANQRVGVTVNAPSTSGYDSSTAEVQVQRQLADGSWREVRGMTDKAHTVGSATLVGYDYEADRGVTNTYRARVSMWHTVDAVRRYSAWDTETVTGPTAGTWNLKAVDLPASNWLGVPVVEKPSESSQAPAATLEPLDRDRPIVLIGVLGGFAGSLEVWASGTTAVAALKALEAYRGTVYLEDAYGETRWLAITRVEWQRAGTSAAPIRPATIEYVEVGSGLEEHDA